MVRRAKRAAGDQAELRVEQAGDGVDACDFERLILGKLGQDIALMAQDGGEIVLSGGGASSAMAHKQNPVSAEALVTLARFNATALAGLHQSLVHEQERSGSAWTLEWMLLPQMAVAAGSATRLAGSVVRSIEDMGSVR